MFSVTCGSTGWFVTDTALTFGPYSSAEKAEDAAISFNTRARQRRADAGLNVRRIARALCAPRRRPDAGFSPAPGRPTPGRPATSR